MERDTVPKAPEPVLIPGKNSGWRCYYDPEEQSQTLPLAEAQQPPVVAVVGIASQDQQEGSRRKMSPEVYTGLSVTLCLLLG